MVTAARKRPGESRLLPDLLQLDLYRGEPHCDRDDAVDAALPAVPRPRRAEAPRMAGGRRDRLDEPFARRRRLRLHEHQRAELTAQPAGAAMSQAFCEGSRTITPPSTASGSWPVSATRPARRSRSASSGTRIVACRRAAEPGGGGDAPLPAHVFPPTWWW